MSDIRWEGYSHEEIYARVQQGPGRLASADAEAAWTTVENTIRDVDAQLSRAVDRIGAGWQGRGAEAVQGGMTVMSSWALDAAGDATLTRNGITGQAEQAARLRTAMPPPRTAEWNHMVNEQVPAVGLMAATGDLGALEDRMANDRAAAVDLMNRYSSQSSDNQRMMNYWTQPPTVVVETAAPGPATGGGARVGEGTGAVGALVTAGAVGAAGALRSTGSVGTAGSDTTPPGPPSAAATGATSTGAAPPGAGPDGTVAGPAAAGAAPGPVTSAGSAAGRTGPAGGPATPTGPSPDGPGRPRADQVPGSAGPVIAPPIGSSPGRTGPGVVPRPTAPGAFPGSGTRPGGVPYAPGAVRPIVPGPPTPAGTPDWRTGLRPAPGEPVPPARPGGPATEPTPRPLGTPVDGERTGRTSGGHGFVPVSGAARPVDQQHQRPAYLVDDTDAFADDRWFPPPVIGADVSVARG